MPQLSFADSAVTPEGVEISPINLTVDRRASTDEMTNVKAYLSVENTASNFSSPPFPARIALQVGEHRYFPKNTPLVNPNEYTSNVIAPNTTREQWLLYKVPKDVDGNVSLVISSDTDGEFSPQLYWNAPNGSLQST